ncbi:ATP-binding cassette domain-containing protein [Pasteurellaceae bacterium 22721_9_1]
MLQIHQLQTGILQQIHLTLSSGEVVAILGPSGSGKSTLLNAIAGYIHYQGQILLNGKSIDSLPPWKRNCRYLNQNLYLFPHLTVGGNLTLAQSTNKTKTDNAIEKQYFLLEKLKIDHLIHRYPTEISGGEQQRAALARVLIKQPNILLLDEPSSTLDWETKQSLWHTVKQLITEFKITTILVTHEPKEANFLANRCIHLNQGKII